MSSKMRLITCKKCGAKVSNQYTYCTNCQVPLSARELEETEGSTIRSKSRSTLAEWLLSPIEPKRGTKYKLSSDSRQGAFVGAFVGLIHGIVVAIVAYFVILPFVMPLVTKQLVNDPRFIAALPRVLSILSTFMSVVVVLAVPFGALIGCVLGVLFVKLMKHIPGSSIIRKSMTVSLILVVISFLGVLRNLLAPTTSILLGADSFPWQLKSFALTLIEYPLLGWLFGYLLTRKLGHK